MEKKVFSPPPSLFNFRGNTDMVLFLLQKELRGVRICQLFNPLVNSDLFYPNLGILILSLMKLPHQSEEFIAWYEKKLEKWSAKVDLENNAALAELTLQFYYFLRYRQLK